jgi:hypothetical protein
VKLQVKLALQGNLKDFAFKTQLAAAQGVTNAATRMATRVKLALREDVRRAGLGDRIANTWQANIYPTNKPSLHAAALVYSKAPEIITAFTDDITIHANNGVYLAIPTENVPHIGNRRMKVRDVELRFGQKLILIRSKHSQNLLGFVDVVPAKSGHGFRKRTEGRSSRATKRILMFVFVRQVRLAKRLTSVTDVADRFSGEWEALIGEEVAKQIGD